MEKKTQDYLLYRKYGYMTPNLSYTEIQKYRKLWRSYCMGYIKIHPEFIKHVAHDTALDPILLRDIVAENWELIKYMPNNLKTKEIMDLALNQNKEAKEYFPTGLETSKLGRDQYFYSTVKLTPSEQRDFKKEEREWERISV